MSPISFNGGLQQAQFMQQMRSEFQGQPANDFSGSPIGDLQSLPAAPDETKARGAQGAFDNVLGTFVREVNAKQTAAGDAVTGLISGQRVPLHQAMIAMEEASVSFQLMVQVRNKLLEGYKELMSMQV